MVLATLHTAWTRGFQAAHTVVLERHGGFAEIQERMNCRRTEPSVARRSTAYRFGAFNLLAQKLRSSVAAGKLWRQRRFAARLTGSHSQNGRAPGTFDEKAGCKSVFVVTTGAGGKLYFHRSLYLCATGLLPPGLQRAMQFWSDPAAR